MELTDQTSVAIIGLGYVGLPLAAAFGTSFTTVGFDINPKRIEQLSRGIDVTQELDTQTLLEAKLLKVTSDKKELEPCQVFIVTVPTPIDKNNRPDIRPLLSASKTVGQVLKPGDVVIYESTVYPGCTEEDCVPVLEKESGLTYNKDFFCGYSPERINPGDKEHTVRKILKVTSGSTPEVATFVDQLYKKVITAGTYQASSIRVAEAAKVIENSQRDINIAFVNELALIFEKMGIDTREVLEAAGTKWNFLKFQPGLVGGHCIGVDPYYLTHKAEELGYHPEIILAGRRLNDRMGQFVASEVVKGMIQQGSQIKDAPVLVLGITFKENCPDIRNSKAIDVIRELQSFGCKVDVYDPWADSHEVQEEYQVELVPAPNKQGYQAIVLVVAHKEFTTLELGVLQANQCFLYDVKGILPKNVIHKRL